MKQKLYTLLIAILIGCSSNNDIEKIAEANSLISSGNFEKGIQVLDELNNNSSSNEIKKALGNAHLQYGNFLMYNEELDRKIRYKTALIEFRKALEFDNSLVEARSNAEMIESIYASMGKEIPN